MTTLLASKQYIKGQSDGMKLYKKETRNGISYTFAASLKDANLKFNANITIAYNAMLDYVRHIR